MQGVVNQFAPTKVDGLPAAPLRWLFPPRCVVCGERGLAQRDLCAACHAGLPWQGPACRRCALPLPQTGICGACLQASPDLPLQSVQAAFAYRFPLDRLLPQLKFHRDFAAGRVLAQCMAERFSALPRPALIVPVPLHQARLRQRGYDQAMELAKPLARALRVPLCSDLLVRSRHTAAQSRLDAPARRRNLHGAFRVRKDAQIPARVLLCDDVMTTGATLQAAAQALQAAGVQHVEAWVCARVA